MENRAGLIQEEREVEIESATQIGSGRKRADCLFRTDKARYDKLVMLVNKLLGLMPKLRAATAESEDATLQNAVTATDQQIDQLVYELFGLTPEEIGLVGAANENANGVSSFSPRLPAPCGLPWVRGIAELVNPSTQGSRGAPTLGWMPLPRWGKPRKPVPA